MTDQAEATMQITPNGDGELLKIQEITLRYGGVTALDDVSMVVPEGKIVGVIGPNGAGKTTLFDCVGGSNRPHRGRAIYAGRFDLIGLPAWTRAWLGIGRTFQNVQLFGSLTGLENMLIAQERFLRQSLMGGIVGLDWIREEERLIRERAEEVIELFNFKDYAYKQAWELSTGTLRLLELQCVLCLKPRLLLLDEPASGLSQKETEAMGPLLIRVRDTTGATLFMIEHDMPLIMGISDLMYALDYGRVIAHGTPKEVQEDAAVVESYLGRAAETMAPEDERTTRKRAT